MFASRTNWNLSSNRLAQALAEFRAAGKKLLDLTASNPTTCGFRYDQAAILNSLTDANALKYEPDPHGLLQARKAVCEYYAERSECVSADDLFLTASTSEAYSFIFRLLCDPGDEILIPTPSYPLFEFLADLQDVKLVRYPLFYDHGWHIDFHSLEQAVTQRTRAVIVVHPNNPTGHFTKREEMAALNRLCYSGEMAIIADEVFLDFQIEDGKAPSFSGNTEALSFTMSGLSKISGLPQMKLAWIVVSGPASKKEEALARLEVIADTYLSVSTPIQLAVPVLLTQRYNFQNSLMSRVRQNLAELDRQLEMQKSCTRLRVEAGWYIVLRIPAIRQDDELALKLLQEHGVYVHPGHFYDFPGDGSLVLSLITPESEFAEGLVKILSLF